jgi:hypothetical protein
MFNVAIIEIEVRLCFYFSIRHFILTSNTDAWNYFTTKGIIAHDLEASLHFVPSFKLRELFYHERDHGS